MAMTMTTKTATKKEVDRKRRWMEYIQYTLIAQNNAFYNGKWRIDNKSQLICTIVILTLCAAL